MTEFKVGDMVRVKKGERFPIGMARRGPQRVTAIYESFGDWFLNTTVTKGYYVERFELVALPSEEGEI